MVARGRQAAELRPMLDDVHEQVSVRAPHPHALRRLLLRVQRLRPDFRAGQLSDTVRASRSSMWMCLLSFMNFYTTIVPLYTRPWLSYTM